MALAGSDEILVADLAGRVAIIRSTLDRVRLAEGEVVIEAIRAPPGRAIEFASAIKQLAERQRTAGGRPLRGDAVISADGRSLTIVAPQEELDTWKRLADQAWPSTPATKQYFVAGFDSETLCTVLNEAVQAQDSTADEVRIFANSFTGAVTVTASEETHRMLEALVTELRSLPTGARQGTERLPVRHRVAADLAEQLADLVTGDSGFSSRQAQQQADTAEVPVPFDAVDTPAGGPAIAIDEATNSLLVSGTPAQISATRRLTVQLDTPISQVMLEVLLVSLSDSETLDLGVELERIEVGGGTLFRLSSLFGLGTDAAATSLPGAGSGLTGVVLDPGEFSVLVRALETINEGRSLSMPRVLVANSQEAEFNSVTQHPILSTNASDVVATTSFGGFEDAGTTITVAPQILAGEQLNLDYSVTLSAFVGESSDPALPPPRQQNQLSSSITIPDSYTVAVGGIEFDTFGDAESRIPLIGRVPLIGELFKNRSKSRSRTRFYVFIRGEHLSGRGVRAAAAPQRQPRQRNRRADRVAGHRAAGDQMSPQAATTRDAPSGRFLAGITREFARTHLVLSRGRDGGTELLLAAGTTPRHIIHNIGVHLGCPVSVTVGDAEVVARCIDQAYETLAPDTAGTAVKLTEGSSLDAARDEADRDLLSMATKGDTSRFVDALLFEALARGASDVHVQPTADATLCRYRLDGVAGHRPGDPGSRDLRDCQPHQDPRQSRYHRAAPGPGRTDHRGHRQKERVGPLGRSAYQHAAHAARRAGRHPAARSRAGRGAPVVREARHARRRAGTVQAGRGPHQRHRARHRPHGVWQEHHAVRDAPLDRRDPPGRQPHDDRGPDRVRPLVAGDRGQPGASEPEEGRDVRERATAHPQARPRRHHDR